MTFKSGPYKIHIEDRDNFIEVDFETSEIRYLFRKRDISMVYMGGKTIVITLSNQKQIDITLQELDTAKAVCFFIQEML